MYYLYFTVYFLHYAKSTELYWIFGLRRLEYTKYVTIYICGSEKTFLQDLNYLSYFKEKRYINIYYYYKIF